MQVVGTPHAPSRGMRNLGGAIAARRPHLRRRDANQPRRRRLGISSILPVLDIFSARSGGGRRPVRGFGGGAVNHRPIPAIPGLPARGSLLARQLDRHLPDCRREAQYAEPAAAGELMTTPPLQPSTQQIRKLGFLHELRCTRAPNHRRRRCWRFGARGRCWTLAAGVRPLR